MKKRCFRLTYEHRFRMPRIQQADLVGKGRGHVSMPPYPLDDEYANVYYTLTYGAGQICMLHASSSTSMEPGLKQHTWLGQTLADVNRDRTPLCD